MKQNENKASQSKQQKQCRSSRNGGSAQSLSFEDRQKIAEREARRNGYESIEYVCDVDGKSVYCTIYDKTEACIIGLPEFIEVNYDGTVRSIQGFDYMDLIEDDLDAAELIKQCHYFKGEDVNPYDRTDQNKAMIWFYESVWVTQRSSGHTLTEYLNEYLAADLRSFEAEDKVPVSLKALLFNRYMKGSSDGNAEPFKAFYRQYYSSSEQPQRSTKDDLIAKCHVFNGEDQCPSDLTEWNQYIWKYERFWVDSTIIKDSDLQAFVQDYIDAGLKDFQSDDQTAIELKAIFYNRHCKHNETTDPEGFMQWYVDIYQQTSKQQTR